MSVCQSECVCRFLTAHKNPFSATRKLKAELGPSDTYREIKGCGRTQAI